MTRPQVKFFDASTGEEIIREMNDAEYEIHLRDLTKFQAEENELQERMLKRIALLEKLGITEEEANILLS